MNKYKIDIISGSIEFATEPEAIEYAVAQSIDTGSIYSVTESVVVDKEAEFEALVAAGFPIGTSSLALTDVDRATFSSMLALVNEGLMLGQMTTESMVTIKSQEGDIIPLTALQFKITMLQYGFYYKTIWDAKQ
jgi:hypothetical protein